MSYSEEKQTPSYSEPSGSGQQSEWQFSFYGLFWAVLTLGAVIALFSGEGFIFLIVGALTGAYSVYLFRGGRNRFIIF